MRTSIPPKDLAIPDKTWTSVRTRVWVIQDLVPTLKEQCGRVCLNALISCTPLGDLDKMRLRAFAKETDGLLIDPDTLEFRELRVACALNKVQIHGGDLFGLVISSAA
jgi:hypothetical protein